PQRRFVGHLRNAGKCNGSEPPPYRNSVFNLPADLGFIPVLSVKITAKKILPSKTSHILKRRRAINDLRGRLYCKNLRWKHFKKITQVDFHIVVIEIAP